MSHHVARLIHEAEHAEAETKAAAEERCRRAILELWRERRSLNAPAPLGSVDRIAEAIAHLREPGRGWYLQRLEKRDHPGDRSLRTAINVDGAAREIIRWCLCEALCRNGAEEARWLVWLNSPLFSGERDLELARQLVADLSLFSPPGEASDPQAVEARARIVHLLRALASMAEDLAGDVESLDRKSPSGAKLKKAARVRSGGSPSVRKTGK